MATVLVNGDLEAAGFSGADRARPQAMRAGDLKPQVSSPFRAYQKEETGPKPGLCLAKPEVWVGAYFLIRPNSTGPVSAGLNV